MKPRLIKIHGVWHCGIMYMRVGRIGEGFTPKEAYDDWAKA